MVNYNSLTSLFVPLSELCEGTEYTRFRMKDDHMTSNRFKVCHVDRDAYGRVKSVSGTQLNGVKSGKLYTYSFNKEKGCLTDQKYEVHFISGVFV